MSFKSKEKIKQLKKQAESGDADAQYELGYAYYTDSEKGDNGKHAVYWLEKAANQGHTEAEYLYAHCLLCRVGVRFSNENGALPYLLNAAKKGHVQSMLQVAELYSSGLTCTDWDFDKAFYWLKKAAESGDAEAEHRLGETYVDGFPLDFDKEFKGCNPQEGLVWLEKAAGKGYLFAAKKLGDIYFEGKVVEKNIKRAIEWYEKGANDRNSDALLKLGEMCFSGENGEQNYEKAFTYFEKSANCRHAGACKRMGDCYYLGLGVAKDLNKALELYKRAAIWDDMDFYGAKSNLALMYAKETPFKNDREAVIALRHVYNYTENPEIFYETAKRHLVGYDFRDAEHTYECYVIRQDLEEAAYDFNKAAEMGHLPSCYEYGKCLFEGIGVEKNTEQAKIWLKKAAYGGDKSARDALKKYFNEDVETDG